MSSSHGKRYSWERLSFPFRAKSGHTIYHQQTFRSCSARPEKLMLIGLCSFCSSKALARLWNRGRTYLFFYLNEPPFFFLARENKSSGIVFAPLTSLKRAATKNGIFTVQLFYKHIMN